MTGSWEFWDEDPAPESRAHLSYYSKGRSDSIYFHDSPGETRGLLFADALNVHEAAGLTPSQLQARVAELGAETLELKRHASEISKQWCATAMHDAKVGEREKKRISELEGALSTFVSDAVEDDVKGDVLVLSSPESLKLARKVLGQ